MLSNGLLLWSDESDGWVESDMKLSVMVIDGTAEWRSRVMCASSCAASRCLILQTRFHREKTTSEPFRVDADRETVRKRTPFVR